MTRRLKFCTHNQSSEACNCIVEINGKTPFLGNNKYLDIIRSMIPATGIQEKD